MKKSELKQIIREEIQVLTLRKTIREEIKTLVHEDWWDNMSSEDQDSYIEKHPNSAKAKDAKKKKSPDKAENWSNKNIDVSNKDSVSLWGGKSFGNVSIDIDQLENFNGKYVVDDAGKK